MYNIIPLILILISLCIIIVVVVRKFSVLAALDVGAIQAEREAVFKERIISSRLKRTFYKYYSRLVNVMRPIGQAIGNFFQWLQKKLVEFKENNAKEAAAILNDAEKINRLFTEAEELLKAEKLDEAEKRYIAIISMDKKNFKAFRALGKLYYERKDYHEARQTLEHVLKLCEKNLEGAQPVGKNQAEDRENNGEIINALAATYFDIALVCRATDNLDGAFTFANKAIKIEPNNPRYLDFKLEISIIKKDKIAALDAYEQLLAVNPENQKLVDLKEQISKL